jgi:hypothetical protein
MNRSYYDKIGKYMIASWLECFSNDYVLHLYLEDFSININDSRLLIEDWNDITHLQSQWKLVVNEKVEGKLNGFVLKGLTQIHHWTTIKGKSLWLDADMIFLKSINSNVFDETLGEYPLASWGLNSFESGTVFVDTTHLDFRPILETYSSIFLENGLPAGERWYDGELLGFSCKINGSKNKDLWILAPGAKTQTPLNRSSLSQYMIHYKAKRKYSVEAIDALKERFKYTQLKL